MLETPELPDEGERDVGKIVGEYEFVAVILLERGEGVNVI